VAAVYGDITEAFGQTPLVRLNRVVGDTDATVLAKLEFYNPSSSVKDRLAISVVNAAEASGELKPGGTIVEATSGNTGIALGDGRCCQRLQSHLDHARDDVHGATDVASRLWRGVNSDAGTRRHEGCCLGSREGGRRKPGSGTREAV